MALNPALQELLAAETAALSPAIVHVITADDASLAAIGPNPLAPQTAAAALTAGVGQAEREEQKLKAIWETRPRRYP
jgi:NTE family protein